MGSSGGGRAGGEGSLKGLHSPSLFTAPRGDREGGGWTEGWIGMPVEKKKKIFYSSRTVVAGGLPLTVDLCVFFQWTAVHWTCF